MSLSPKVAYDQPTMAQRISRAKETIRTGGARFDLPSKAEQADPLRVVDEQKLYRVITRSRTSSVVGVAGVAKRDPVADHRSTAQKACSLDGILAKAIADSIYRSLQASVARWRRG